MLGYVTIGTNNIEQARAFYGALLADLGMKELFDNERLYFYGDNPKGPYVVVGGPHNKQAATVGNGMDPHTAVGPDEHGIDNRDRDADADRKAEELVMREAFRSENKKGTDFDWNGAYGNGYDVLGHTTRTELQSAP